MKFFIQVQTLVWQPSAFSFTRKVSKAANSINAFVLVLALGMILFGCGQNSQSPILVSSPDGKNVFELSVEKGKDLSFEIKRKIDGGESKTLIQVSSFKLKANELDFSGDFEITNVSSAAVSSEWETRYGELSTIPDNYQETRVSLQNAGAKWTLLIRAYNEGLAFAYEIPSQNGLKSLTIDDEIISYQFDQDYAVWSTPERKRGRLTAQGEYQKIPLSEIKIGAERPLLIEYADDLKIALAEARLVDYARLSYQADPDTPLSILSSLDGKLQKAKQDTITGALKSERSQVAKVKMNLPFQSPWWVIMIGESYGDLLEKNYLIQNLNDPSAIEDDAWIQPGKVLRETTLTTEGGLRAVDFVAAHNMQYVHFDAGWYGNEMKGSSDATTITLDPKRSKGPF